MPVWGPDCAFPRPSWSQQGSYRCLWPEWKQENISNKIQTPLLKIWCWSNKGRGTALRSFRSPCWCKSQTSLGLVPVCFDTGFHRAGPSVSWWSVCRAPTPGCCSGGCCRTMPTGGGILWGRLESARWGWTHWSKGTCPHQGRRQTETSCAATGRRVILKTTFRMERIFRWKSVLSAASVKWAHINANVTFHKTYWRNGDNAECWEQLLVPEAKGRRTLAKS